MAALVTGWGRLSSSGPLADVLQEATVRTLSIEQCRRKYGQSRISDNMICAEEPGKDSCEGDNGGPLAVLGQDGSYRQIGVVSWGRGCARQGYPGVYTRLSSLLGWIQDRISNTNNDNQGEYIPIRIFPVLPNCFYSPNTQMVILYFQL